MMKAHVTIKLRPSILDVQGKAVEHGVHSMGLEKIQHIRIGKYITMDVDTNDPAEAMALVTEACKRLLANPVMEDFTVTLDSVSHP